MIATGARREEPFEHATTFRGQEDSEKLHGLIQDLEGQYARRIAFVVPTGVTWTLPLYELALMTARRAYEMSLEGVELTFVTPEDGPLAVFGPGPSDESANCSSRRASPFAVPCTRRCRARAPSSCIRAATRSTADRVVTLARLRGQRDPVAAPDEDGFLPIDNHGRVVGVENVYAAGDGTNFPVKQGGIACQQADAVAEVIARAAGASIEPRSFRPVLRGQLITGRESGFMRTNLSGREGDSAQSSPRDALVAAQQDRGALPRRRISTRPRRRPSGRPSASRRS